MTERTGTNAANSKQAAKSCPQFAGHVSDQSAFEHIMYIRAAERMRIADQLHDSALQLLALLQLNLGRMRRQGAENLEATISECEDVVSRIGCEIRAACDADD